ncbi:uncharacterized protein LOC127282045 [Leptopilina boulardi]|uniref:uncharacterized protein LOC127282045 n=1 Tax=Leptopilina boulardi TaxID=63433 RepID=UPI0021F551E2|nr:uncharacterized protein LOC127282045 [Leptopilina boulardi]
MYKISSGNFLGNITVEVRPRLRSCIVFIYIGDNDPSLIDVKLSETSIKIKCEKISKNLILPSVKLLPTSLSSLRITSKWISFRVQTNPDTIFGTFKTEIMNDIARTITMENSLIKQNLPQIGSQLLLRCKCCENIITNIINCKRVLPLPNRDCDPGEWFCCKHTKVDFAKLLIPQDTDYFYGPAFCVLNNNNFQNLIEKYNTILCKKCLTILGIKEDNESMRIWNCCVERKINDDKEFQLICQSPLDEFVSTIKDCSEIMGEEILMEALEGNKTHYILMKPMEWQLELLTESNIKWEGESIRLKKSQVIKVFYKYGECKKSVRNEFVHSKYYLIALPLLIAGIEHLICSTKRFPPSYRTVTQYCVGYINIKNSFTHGI